MWIGWYIVADCTVPRLRWGPHFSREDRDTMFITLHLYLTKRRWTNSGQVRKEAFKVQCRYNAVNVLTNIHKRHPRARPYGVSFVNPAPDWYSASVLVIIYVISYNIGPRYNSTRLYLTRRSWTSAGLRYGRRHLNANSWKQIMMTSSNGNIFRVTGHFCGEFTDDRWIPRTKVSYAELWCFLWSAPE